MSQIYDDAQKMIKEIIGDNMPRHAVEEALKKHSFKGNVHLVAIGKAAWTMAEAASDFLGEKLVQGIIVTKYEHAQGELPRIDICEAGHPVSDENTIAATQKCIELAQSLTADDELLFLVSGGGSALFEKPAEGVTLDDIKDVTNQLLASGADIVEMNMVRKRFSSVKAGRFAKLAEPAHVFAIILSDVLGDRLDSIASGPAVPDHSTVEDAAKVVEKYNLKLTDLQRKYLLEETPKEVCNVETVITGSVRTLCESAARVAKTLGYTPVVLTTTMNCEASEAGRLLAAIAADTHAGRNSFKKPCAIIAGGETVVTLKGKGKGGRNQEIALAGAKGIAGLEDTLIFSLGSDGTDGPTNAAGGITCGKTIGKMREKGLDTDKILSDNNAYHGLQAIDGLIITGPTGTNVNDVTVILCK
ncbi:MAG: glycerate kinase [Defluviitaleaceae bacterium]|nr:glycerate kinase [Defluviitaleaceae bacterium]